MTAAVQAGALSRESALASDGYREVDVDMHRRVPQGGLLRGLSRMWGNSQVRFLGGWAAAIPPGYPAGGLAYRFV